MGRMPVGETAWKGSCRYTESADRRLAPVA